LRARDAAPARSTEPITRREARRARVRITDRSPCRPSAD
jgi:hypothetical protein